MAMTAKVAFLLLGLIVACSAGVSRHQAADNIGPFNKAILLGKGLAAQKRGLGMLDNGCTLDACWNAYYSKAFTDRSSCDTAWIELQTCVESWRTSDEVCKCDFHQVYQGMQLHDMCATIHTTTMGDCIDPKGQACLANMVALSQAMMQPDPAMSVDQKTALFTAARDCAKEGVQGGFSTAGCELMFPKDLDKHLLIPDAWSRGCDASEIGALCPSPIAMEPQHCGANTDIVGTFYECAKRELTSDACQNFLPEVKGMLNKFKEEDCAKINYFHQAIVDRCGSEGHTRTLLKRLLNLLQTQKK